MNVPNPMHPIQQLAQELRSEHTRFAPLPPVVWHEAVARYGIGLDHLAGEMPLAFLSADLPKPYTMSYVVTDRRVIGRVWASDVSDTISDVTFAWITGVRRGSGILIKPVEVQVGDRLQRLHVFGDPVERFLRRVTQLPPEHRSFPPLSPQPGPGDETAAMAASHLVVSGDQRVATLIRAIHGAHAQGVYGAHEAYDLVARALLLDRKIAHGRGMRNGWWSSLTPRALLGQLLPAVLGAPSGAWSDGANDTFDFPIGGGGGSNVAANVVGLALFAAVGVGFYRRNVGGPALRGIRVVLADAAPYGGYSLQGLNGNVWQPLSFSARGIVDAIHQTVLAMDARVLLSHVAFGPQMPVHELLAHPPELLQQRVSAISGAAIDLSPFFPRAQ